MSDDYSMEWVRRVAGPEGIGNYPAKSEALAWCIQQLDVAAGLLVRVWGFDDPPTGDRSLLQSFYDSMGIER